MSLPAKQLDELQDMVVQYAREMFTSHVLWSLTLTGSFVLLAINMRRPSLGPVIDLWPGLTTICQFVPLSILGTFGAYFILRTFFYDCLIRMALWLTPQEELRQNVNATVRYVMIPPWLGERLQANVTTYRDVNKDLFNQYPFGCQVDGAWTRVELQSSYQYLRIVMLAAIPWTRFPRPTELVECIFGGLTNMKYTYWIPLLFGTIVALWAYVFLVPIAA